MSERFLLCRPEGGLNDTLVQIERCCRYAELHGRTVVVQADAPQSVHFRDSLDRYFRSTQPRLVLDAAPYIERFRTMELQPGHVAGRLDDYLIDHDGDHRVVIDRTARLPLTFDFTRDHRVPLLLHHQVGGGRLAHVVLLRMVLRASLVEELERRIAAIGGPYTGIHVRHTDLQSNYEPVLARLARQRERRLFLATDNAAVRDAFRARLGDGRLFSFAALDGAPGTPQHNRQISGEAVYVRNRDAILDLLMLALARRLMIPPVINSEWGNISGFSQLAHELWRSKVLMNHLLSESGLRFGLDEA